MIELTYKDSSYFGYEGGKLNQKTKSNTFSWTFTPCSRSPLSFKDECVRTAELLATQANELGREPVVMLSGGQDSEVVCKAFIEGGIPFRASSFKHNDDELLPETEFIDRFVKRHGLKHTYLSRDWYAWMLTEEAQRMYIESDSMFTSYVFPIALYEQIWNDGGYPIGGAGDAHLDNIGGTWHFVNQESLLTTWHKYAVNHGIHGATMFFQHTPEIMLSMLLEPEYQTIGSGSNKLANVVLKTVQEEKYRMYYRLWPDIERRKKYYQYMSRLQMFRGLELTRNSLRVLRFDEKWKMPYNDFVNLLKGEH